MLARDCRRCMSNARTSGYCPGHNEPRAPLAPTVPAWAPVHPSSSNNTISMFRPPMGVTPGSPPVLDWGTYGYNGGTNGMVQNAYAGTNGVNGQPNNYGAANGYTTNAYTTASTTGRTFINGTNTTTQNGTGRGQGSQNGNSNGGQGSRHGNTSGR
ncbi:hypothetical protein BT69DRAFT_1298682 [Atractiella rhizophila]|nr:hypothetical protein BT69DRAFT_1298682 [Atractiella rhizophila]